MKFSFDGIEKIVQVETGVTSFTCQECYIEWKDWVLIDDNIKYVQAFRYVGGDPLPGSKALGITYFLLNGWKIRPYSGNHVLAIDGNLYSEDGTSPYTVSLGSYNVMITNSVSTLVDATIQQLPEIEHSSFNNAVTIDVDNGFSGTLYPIGTSLKPVNNLDDAKIIASNRGFNRINLLSNLIVTSGQNIDELIFESDNWLELTIEPNVSSINTEFIRLSVYGEMGGFWNIMNDCWIYDITNFCGWLRGGSFVNIELAPYTIESAGQSYFDNVLPMYPNEPATIVMNTDTIISFTEAQDTYKIDNMTSGSIASIGLGNGKLIIDSSCIGGEIIVTGTGNVINNSNLIIDDSKLVNSEIISDNVWDYSTSATNFSNINSIGYYIKSKVLNITKFLALK